MMSMESGARNPAGPTGTAEAEIIRAVDAYVQSINFGSAEAGGVIFHDSEGTMFIHPRGTERGWRTIATEIYDFFRTTFSRRELKLSGPPHIEVYGDTAVVDFEWNFDATFANGDPLHTTGRESQIYHRFRDKGWRIVHLHYSGPPVTEAGQGF